MIDKNMTFIKVAVAAIDLIKLIQIDFVSNIPTVVNKVIDAVTTNIMPI